MNALLIYNPSAGGGRVRHSVSAVNEAFGPWIGETLITKGAGDARAAARRASENPAIDAIFAAGGDGTINEIINGLMSREARARPSLSLLLIPLGTQNVLAHELRIPDSDLNDLASMIRTGKTRIIDLGVAEGHYFSLMAGFGFDAAVVRDVALPVKDLVGPAAYALAALRTLANYRSASVRLRLDGEEVSSEAFLVIVANASSYAYRQWKMTPFASMDDGWLDICVFERAPFARVGFATQIMAVMARRHLRDPRVRYYRARRIEIDSDPPIQGQIDGDAFQNTPVNIEIVPKALTVFAP